ncbi:MAG TPA: TIGR04282 family arsenosugar biosynthesis glycosyltransferase [Usitatibacter sp.]|nr:TIGR04282 family arsenosugar biosynthesis glycosyltransferase [Usitatibacter sp.]
MSNARGAERPGVAVFAKAPVPGTVKTRLIGRLGARGAARLHEALVDRALATAAESSLDPVELWCSPDAGHGFFAACADRHRVRLRAQAGRDLGERMAFAFEDAFAHARPLVLVGSDCPALRSRDLLDAADALLDHDAAITPAEDGGYVLIALARRIPELFSDMPWGTDRVMQHTRERLAAACARWLELPQRWDVDRPEDLERMRREGLLAQTAW